MKLKNKIIYKIPETSGTSRHAKYINILSKMAYDNIPVDKARIAAGLVYKNHLISIGVNKRKTHPFQKRYGKNKDCIYLHAEIEAIKNALNLIDLNKISHSTLYVSRVKIHNGKCVFGLAKPCKGCMKAISTFDIRKVYFTTNNGDYNCL